MKRDDVATKRKAKIPKFNSSRAARLVDEEFGDATEFRAEV